MSRLRNRVGAAELAFVVQAIITPAAENVEIEHPYVPGGPLRIVGRVALVAHIRDALARFTIEHVATRYVYHVSRAAL
jgi:hypothetical protein